MFKPFDKDQSITAIEQSVLDFWRENQTFKQSVSARSGKTPFIFYEGPPTANAAPAIHHVLARTFKDTICRYQTQKGKYVARKAGWDTHGLPVELQVEKALGLKNKEEIEEYGIAEFNEKCQQSVWQYKEEWQKLTERIGYWIDFEDAYITYDRNYIQSVWWGLKQVWDKGLVYEGYKVVPYCSRCGTSLSLAEVAQGYKDITETSVYIKFKLKSEPNTFILAWTTTPWTLPGNVALAVGKNILYTKVKQGGDIYYLASERLSILRGEYTVLNELKGEELIGKEYTVLIDEVDLAKETGKTGYRILSADFVTTEDGTGVVHTAVMYGEDDFVLGQSHDLPARHTVDEQGRFNELVPQWTGRAVKETEPDIIDYLNEHGLLYKTEQITHSYPFCWRCDTPLLYYARNSWFVRIDDKMRSRLVKLNQTINWIPNHIKDGRFGNWLAGLRDWSISRERYWGTPIPIWICQKDSKHRLIVASLDELRAKANIASVALLDKPEFDLHKPYIDAIVLNCPDCKGEMHRIPQVLDAWFDSGSMPFAQWGYPLQNKAMFAKNFPADFIAEGIDQTRGWFNSMLILSTIIFDQKAYASVIAPNLVNDEKGQKMSKSKGNVVDPASVIDKTGVDALRLYFLSVNQPSENKNFALAAVSEVYRKTIMIWWNTANFFLTYAETDNWQPDNSKVEPTLLDQWIKARVIQATTRIDSSLAALDTFAAARELRELIDELSTWYLRRSRKRRDGAFYSTLHQILIDSTILAAPILPFMAEHIYQALRTEDMAESVHLTDYPVPQEPDAKLLADMTVVRQIVSLGHAARAQAGIKVRQPLNEARVAGLAVKLSKPFLDIATEELNVTSITIVESLPEDWLTATDGPLSVGLDPDLTTELKEEGFRRDLIRGLQDLRKKAGYKPGQMVDFYYSSSNPDLEEILSRHRQGMLAEVAGNDLIRRPVGTTVAAEANLKIDDRSIWLGIG